MPRKSEFEFPGFDACVEMMTSRDGQVSEDGFHALLPYAGQFVDRLIALFQANDRRIPRFWWLELIVAARSDSSLPVLIDQLSSDDSAFRRLAIGGIRDLNTKEARASLWNARNSISFAAPEETREFQTMIDEIMGWKVNTRRHD